ncbi:MAG: ABC transporter permease [Smithella sp.]
MYFPYILKEIRQHRHRTAVNILGIAVGIALFVSINAVSTAYKDAVSMPFKNLGADLVVQKTEKQADNAARQPINMQGIRLPFSNRIISAVDMQKLQSIPGVASSAASLLLWDFDKDGFRTIMGVDLTQPVLGPVRLKDWLSKGHFPEKEGEIILEKHFAKFHGSQIGDSVVIAGKKFKIVGLLEIKEGAQITSANIYMPLADARNLIPEGSKGVNIVYLRLKNPSFLEEVKGDISRTFPGATISSSDALLEVMGGVAKIFDQFSLIVSLVALGGAVFLIIKTMLGNLVERVPEIGIMKAVGWTGSDVQKQVMAEAFLQSIIGGLTGIAFGYLISYLMGYLSIPVSTPWELNFTPAFAKVVEEPVRTIHLPVSFSVGLTAASLAMSIIVGGLASYFMGRRITQVKPADILRQL